MVGRQFKITSNVLAYIGNASLFILIFHNYIQGAIYWLLSVARPEALFVNGCIAYIAGCAVPLLFWETAKRNRYLAMFWLPLQKNNDDV